MSVQTIHQVLRDAIANKMAERNRALEYCAEHQQKAALWERRVDTLAEEIADLEDFFTGTVMAEVEDVERP
jgi:hypothetical protein